MWLKSSRSWNIADVYLSYYIAELFPSYHFADVCHVLLNCWAIRNLKTLLLYTLSYHMAESFPILKHCWKYSLSFH